MSISDELTRLNELKESGALSEEEFTLLKKKLLAESTGSEGAETSSSESAESTEDSREESPSETPESTEETAEPSPPKEEEAPAPASEPPKAAVPPASSGGGMSTGLIAGLVALIVVGAGVGIFWDDLFGNKKSSRDKSDRGESSASGESEGVTECIPECTAEMQCGDDGCGGVCGECGPGYECGGDLCTATAETNQMLSPFKVGNRWVYTFDLAYLWDREKNRGDESWTIRQEVLRVDPIPGGAGVVIRERGGEKPRIWLYRVKDGCLDYMKVKDKEKFDRKGQKVDWSQANKKKGFQRIFCKYNESLDYEDHRGIYNVKTSSKMGNVRFDPGLGLLHSVSRYREKGKDRQEYTRTLIGYSVNGHEWGEHDVDPLVCAWDDDTKFFHKRRDPDNEQTLKLSGLHGYTKVEGVGAEYGGYDVESGYFEIKGSRSTIHVSEPLPLYRLKVGKSADGQDEYVLGHFEDDYEGVAIIVRLSDRKKRRLEYTKSTESEILDKKFHAGYYIVNNECRFRVLWKGGKRDEVAIYTFDDKKILKKIEGNLRVKESR